MDNQIEFYSFLSMELKFEINSLFKKILFQAYCYLMEFIWKLQSSFMNNDGFVSCNHFYNL